MRRQALSGILHGLRGGQPYRMTPRTGELCSLGVNAYLDDNYIHLHGRRAINEVNLLWREWFDGLYADGAATGRLMVLHLHPWIMGSPGAFGISTRYSATSAPARACGRPPAVRSSTGSTRSRPRRHCSLLNQLIARQSNGDDTMTLPPGRFDYASLNDRPIIKWPNNVRCGVER